MPVHHSFKHLALGSNPIRMTYCSDALYDHWRIIKSEHFPLSSDNIPQGLYAPPAAIQSAQVCCLPPSLTTYRTGGKVMPLHPFGIVAKNFLGGQMPESPLLELIQ